MVFFSIIIPVYRDSERLKLCLEKLNQMTTNNIDFEVIVVNNDSQNTNLDINAENFNFIFREVYEAIPGSYASRNRGIKESKGKIIGFTDSDMLPDSNWLVTAYNFFLKDLKKEIGILTGPVPLFFKDPNHLTTAEIYDKYTGFDFEGYAKEGSCGAGNWFSYKSVLEEFGGFRDDLKSNGDTELSLRISEKYKIFYVPELINRHPARYTTDELVFRYQRILGGAYARKFQGNKIGFFLHTMNFIFRRYRFSVKKFFTVRMKESWAIFKVVSAINLGAIKEFFRLILGFETKR